MALIIPVINEEKGGLGEDGRSGHGRKKEVLNFIIIVFHVLVSLSFVF